MGPLCAEQNVENLKNCTFGNYGTPVRRTRRRKSHMWFVFDLISYLIWFRCRCRGRCCGKHIWIILESDFDVDADVDVVFDSVRSQFRFRWFLCFNLDSNPRLMLTPMSITMPYPMFISTGFRFDPSWWFGVFCCGLQLDLYDGSNESQFGSRCFLFFNLNSKPMSTPMSMSITMSDPIILISARLGLDSIWSFRWFCSGLQFDFYGVTNVGFIWDGNHIGITFDLYLSRVRIWFDFDVDAEVDVVGSIFGSYWNQMSMSMPMSM